MLSRILLTLPDVYPNIVGSRYAGRRIVKRTPFIMPGELTVPAATAGRSYPEGTFLHTQDLPFEVTRMIPFITTLDASAVAQNDPGIGSLRNLYRFVTVQMKLIGAARDMTKAAARLSAMIELGGYMSFDAPLYLETSQGFDITVNNGITAADAAGGIRMEWQFHGSLLELG